MPQTGVSSEIPNRALHGFAVWTAASVVVLLFAGALVTSTGSGLAVPDWPLSYGRLFPPMVGGILYEHGHRMIAGIVALMTTVLTGWILWKDPRRNVKALAVAAWLTVIFQALLGGLTVLLKLPTVVSSAHAGVAQAFFCLIVLLALATSRHWRTIPRETTDSRTLGWISIVTVAVLYGQILIGAWMRHSGAGLAIPDFPLNYGRIVPPLSTDALPELNARIANEPHVPLVQSIGQVWIHFAHRVGAGIVSLFAIALFAFTIKRTRSDGVLIGLSVFLLILLTFQATLGGMVIWGRRAVILTASHLVVGAGMLATSVAYAALYHRRYAFERGSRVSASSRSEGAAA